MMNSLELKSDVILVGSSIGGYAATLSACHLGRKVLLTEETARIGGQFTNQLVPTDEHP